MNCAEARNLMFRQLDGELAESEKRPVDLHLGECSSCAREMRILLLPRRISRAIPAFEPPPFFYQRLRARLEAESQNVTIWNVLVGLSRQLVPAMAAVTLALLSVFAYSQLRGSSMDVYQAYDMIFTSGDRPHQMLIADLDEITDESVLSAIAEDDAGSESNERSRR